MDVIVVGCGVVGLSTAIRLQEAGFDVQMWTADLPQDSTSSVAAATWYPYKAYPQDKVLAWSSRGYEVFEELARDPESGVYAREGMQLWREPVQDPWWRSAVPYLRQCREDELPRGYRYGLAFPQMVIEMPIYLRYLVERFTGSGGRIKQLVVDSLEKAAGEGQTVVNCTGLGARRLTDDDLMTPIRGQVVRVSNPGLDRPLLDEENPAGVAYIVPRTEDCILGGTADEGNWSTEPDPETAARILKRCTALEPRLAEAEVLENKVGLRPGRPTVRLESEELADGTLCIHNYGHGGAGVTLSWGCAEEVLKFIS